MSLIRALSRGRRAEIRCQRGSPHPRRLPAPSLCSEAGPSPLPSAGIRASALSAGARPSRPLSSPASSESLPPKEKRAPRRERSGCHWPLWPPGQLGKKGVFVGAGGLSLPSACVRTFLSRAVPGSPSHPFREKPRPCVRHPTPPAPPTSWREFPACSTASAGAAPPQEETRIPLASVSGIPDCWKRRQGTDYLPNRET